MQPEYKASPTDSRYIPLTQQDWCCVPTSIQMIMYRHDISLIPAEELGYHLGLTVPPDQTALFYKPRTADTPPSGAGYGTQISHPDYEPNKVFQALNIPLSFEKQLASDIKTSEALMAILEKVEAEDSDALLCFNHGVIRGEYKPYSGHVVVFDRVIEGKIRIVDASWKHPKWRLIEPELLFEAIKRHGNDNPGGVWHFKRT